LWHKILVRGIQALGVIVLYLILCSLPLVLGEPTIRVNYIEWVNSRGRPAAANAVNARPLYDEAVKLHVSAPSSLEGKRMNGNAFDLAWSGPAATATKRRQLSNTGSKRIAPCSIRSARRRR